jgi:hypothetical protein
MKKTMALAMLATGLTVGCMSETPIPQDNLDVVQIGDRDVQQNNDFRSLVGQLPVRQGSLDGTIGEIDGLRGDDPTNVSGWGEPNYASIYTVGEGRNGAAMTILELDGGLNSSELVPGAHFEFDVYSSEPGSQLHAYVVGCSGPEENEWDFDQVADNTTIDVSENPEDPSVLVLDYTGDFTDWETGDRSQITGQVEIVRQPNG